MTVAVVVSAFLMGLIHLVTEMLLIRVCFMGNQVLHGQQELSVRLVPLFIKWPFRLNQVSVSVVSF